jgi:predicted metal-binding membrane protein
VSAFVGGYLAAWALAGIVAYALVAAVRALDLGFLAWDRAGRYVAAAVILAAAAYQLTGAKSRCLARCRGVGGGSGVRSGLHHGVVCIGCCGPLMAALFALGVMSLTWMAVISVLIVVERMLPWPRPAVWAVAMALVVLGVWMAAAPGDVPGLTLPGAMTAM